MTSILKYLIIIILFLSSCSEAKDSFPVINLESAGSEIDLNINEILKDVRLVKLELVAGDPIPPYGQKWIGEKHILIFSRSKVYQYTPEGTFVRILMNRGQGPGEYNHVNAYDVNEDKNLLYWTDYGRKGKILVTDLNSGDQLEPIILPYDTHLSYHGLNIIDDNTLLCLNEKYSELDVMFFYLSIDGRLLGSRAQDKLKRTGIFGERSAFFSKNLSSGKYNYMGDSDTLYAIEDTSLVPVFLLESDDRFNNEDNLEGTLPGIKMQGSKYSLLSNDIIIVSNTDAGSSIMPGKTETLIMDNKNHKLERINKLLIDYLALETKNISFTFTNNYAVYSFEAIKLLKISDEALLQKELEPVVRERMKKLAESISENDNPYLLIGKIK